MNGSDLLNAGTIRPVGDILVATSTPRFSSASLNCSVLISAALS